VDPFAPEDEPLPEEDRLAEEEARRAGEDRRLPVRSAEDPEVERLPVVREADGEAPAFGLAELDALDLRGLEFPDLAVEPFVAERVDPEDRVRLLVPLVVAISVHPFVRSSHRYPGSAPINCRSCRPDSRAAAFRRKSHAVLAVSSHSTASIGAPPHTTSRRET
jgi:hypothetical protein